MIRLCLSLASAALLCACNAAPENESEENLRKRAAVLAQQADANVDQAIKSIEAEATQPVAE